MHTPVSPTGKVSSADETSNQGRQNHDHQTRTEPFQRTRPADEYDERWTRAIIEDNAGWADDDRESYFRDLKEAARDMLQKNWRWVEAVADALIERKTISQAEVMELRPRD